MEETVVVNLKINPLKTDVYVDLVYMEVQFRRHRNNSVTIIETGQLVVINCVYCSES